jgi:hypothetical protein
MNMPTHCCPTDRPELCQRPRLSRARLVASSPRWAYALAASLAAAACGGDDGGPPHVASVQVSVTQNQIVVGQTAQASAVTLDSHGNTLTGRAVTWRSSQAGVAAVSDAGLITATAVGTAQIIGASEGKEDTVDVTVVPPPVATVRLDQHSLALAVGGAATLNAAAFDALNNPLSGRVIAWESTNEAAATVSVATGGESAVVTGVGTGSGGVDSTLVIATSEGKSDTAVVHVTPSTGGNVVTITSVAPELITPGAAATIVGTGFSPAAAGNTVTVNGATAAVTAATDVQLTILVPATGMACDATPRGVVEVAVGQASAQVTHPVQVATQLAITPGQAITLSGAQARCNELPQQQGRYLISVYNTDEVGGNATEFGLRGVMGAAAAALAARDVTVKALPQAGGGAIASSLAAAYGPEHMRRLAQERALLQRAPRLRAATGTAGAGARAAQLSVPGAGPVAASVSLTVGDVSPLRVRTGSDNDCTHYTTVNARTVYVGQYAAALEDVTAPLHGTMDDYFKKIVDQYDAVTHPILINNLGDPLAIDAQTDHNGKLLMLFSPAVNNFSNTILGFVSACDFFPQSNDPKVGFPAANQAEIFYAIVPTNPASGFPNNSLNPRGTKDAWIHQIPGVLSHEVKHIVSFAERLARNATVFEDTWLEEATAQIAYELFARHEYGASWKGNTGYRTTSGGGDVGPYCDVRPEVPSCGEAPQGLYLHLNWLQSYYEEPENHSLLGAGVIAGNDGTIYGSSWSFVRWTADQYATSEGNFFKALVQTATDAGVDNLEKRAGQVGHFGDMLGDWSVAMALDDDPDFTPPRPTLTEQSWNFRSLFAGMNQDFPNTFTKARPQIQRSLTFGDFTVTVNAMHGGTAYPVELTGTPTAPETLDFSDGSGGAPATTLRMAIVRVQ